MPKTILALATSLVLATSGAALAQAPQTGGANQGNVNKSGAVGGTGTGAGSMEHTGSTGAGPRVSAPGAPAGSSTGNGSTGSGAAPSGR
ncbi:hypothetical protein [Methylobacterium sp. PvR107]|uniref:hypothetical protein n=1 Tax=Methylobacterium sp. PvR107 TaxID=2806597 RepID=UPI001AE7874B|nr:hypothetical protein [Methylobacterium sp. PvR107]MBP1183131.1 hypothetical protein [Methylobacterium sp. PvR107]